MLLNRLKTRLGITGTAEDAVLTELLNCAKAYIAGYCRLHDYDERLDHVCLMMAAEDYDRLNAEGVDRRNFSGVYESYRDGYSEHIMAELKAARRLAVI